MLRLLVLSLLLASSVVAQGDKTCAEFLRIFDLKDVSGAEGLPGCCGGGWSPLVLGVQPKVLVYGAVEMREADIKEADRVSMKTVALIVHTAIAALMYGMAVDTKTVADLVSVSMRAPQEKVVSGVKYQAGFDPEDMKLYVRLSPSK